MAQILRLIRPETFFDPEALKALGAAYDLAVASLHETGQTGCEIIAGRIVASAMKGERDPLKLSEIALRGISLPAS